MEKHLAANPWFNGQAYGIADIALFAYTVVADEGGFDLTPYPSLRDWLARVTQTPDYLPMPPPPVEAASRLALPD